jgi:hypothetical protein
VLPNPYAILAGVLFWIASLGVVGTWQHHAGVVEQKAECQ